MIVINLISLILLFLVLQSASGAGPVENSKSYRPCLEAMLNITQRYGNEYPVYATTMAYPGTTFGNEVNMYLMRTMFWAFFTNRRFIYLISKRDWEFDCPQKLGWACYLSFPHNDSMVEANGINFSKTRNPVDKFAKPGASFVERETLEALYFNQGGYTDYLKHIATDAYGQVLPPELCKFNGDDVVSLVEVGGLLAQHLFHFNERTTKAITTINKRYDHLLKKSYIGVSLRTQDVYQTIPDDDLKYLFDANFIANRVVALVQNYTTTNKVSAGDMRDIYVGSDNCTLAIAVFQLLTPRGFKLFGNCFSNEMKSKDKKKDKHVVVIPKDDVILSSFAELMMMKKSTLYVTGFHSHMSRIAHYLRYPNFEHSASLLPRFEELITHSLFKWPFFF